MLYTETKKRTTDLQNELEELEQNCNVKLTLHFRLSDSINTFDRSWLKSCYRNDFEIKAFWETSIDAVKIQIYCAIIAYCLIAIVGNKLKADRPIYEILQTLSISLLDKTPVRETLTNCDYKDVKEQNNKQLKISGF